MVTAPICQASRLLRAQIHTRGTKYKIQTKNQSPIKRGVAVNNGPLKFTNKAIKLPNDARHSAASYHLPSRNDFRAHWNTSGVTRMTGPISHRPANNCDGLKMDNAPRCAETITGGQTKLGDV